MCVVEALDIYINIYKYKKIDKCFLYRPLNTHICMYIFLEGGLEIPPKKQDLPNY